MSVVYTGGTFDLIHPGHIRLLKVCREIADARSTHVVASLNRDSFIERYKGHPPVQSLAERIEVVRAIRYVDDVIVNEGDEDSRPAILSVGAGTVVVGSDWAPLSRYCQQMSFDLAWLNYHGVRVHFVERDQHASSRLRLDTPRDGV